MNRQEQTEPTVVVPTAPRGSVRDVDGSGKALLKEAHPGAAVPAWDGRAVVRSKRPRSAKAL